MMTLQEFSAAGGSGLKNKSELAKSEALQAALKKYKDQPEVCKLIKKYYDAGLNVGGCIEKALKASAKGVD